VLDVFGEQRPIADFADLGKLLPMFFAGLEVDSRCSGERSARPSHLRDAGTRSSA
jgi:hypothetical protein